MEELHYSTSDLELAERIAREKHRTRERDGHHTPHWDNLSPWMREELIYREELNLKQLV